MRNYAANFWYQVLKRIPVLETNKRQSRAFTHICPLCDRRNSFVVRASSLQLVILGLIPLWSPFDEFKNVFPGFPA